MTQTRHLPLAAGRLALLMPDVDRWWGRLDALVEGAFLSPPN